MRPLALAAFWYLVPGILWILVSDYLVAALVPDPGIASTLSSLKGIGFVLVTGLVIYRLLRRQHEQLLAIHTAYSETERGFRLLFTNNPLPVWAYDRETLRFLEINDVALAKYGYSRDELLDMKVTDVHPAEEVPALLAVIRRPREVRELSGFWRHRLKDGRVIEVEVQVHDLELYGRPARVVVSLDVTERRRAFEQQQRSAARARALAETALATNLARSTDEILRITSDAARTIIGAHIARTELRCAHTDSVAASVVSVSEAYRAWADTRPPLTDAELRRQVREQNRPLRLTVAELRAWPGAVPQDGSPEVAGWLAAPLVSRGGENLGLIQIVDRDGLSAGAPGDEATFTDEDEAILVQLAQMASAAVESARLYQQGLERERQYRELVEGLDAVVWEADYPSMQFTYVSHQAETILGYPSSAWTDSPEPLLRCFSRENRDRLQAYMRAVAEGRPALPCEVRARALDGRTVWLRVEASARTNAEGEVTRIRGLSTDVTGEREQAERSARGEKLRALGQLSSGVAHDLNQSLALIAGYGELLQRMLDDDPLPADRVRELLDVMVRAASDGGETVRRMLTFVQTPKDEVAVRVDLTSVVHEVIRLTAPRWRDATQAEGRPIEMTVEIEGDVVVEGNAGPLREAMTNLVLNAVDALPQGGAINVCVFEHDGRAHVTVTDDGIGMSDEVRERIFEPFFTTKGDRGTGLGLPTVFGIVAAHRGEITVTSEPGQGTRFELSFPAAPPPETPTAALVTPSASELPSLPAQEADAAPAADAASPDGAAPAIARRCLVVDDEPQLARMLAMMLRREGYDALQALSGDDALVTLQAEPVDLLITDVGMGPSMNGWELAERVRALRPGLPIMLATGWGATIDPESARERGISAILAKPYRRADLAAALERVPWLPPVAGTADVASARAS